MIRGFSSQTSEEQIDENVVEVDECEALHTPPSCLSVHPTGQPSLVCHLPLLPFVYRPISCVLSGPPLPRRAEATEERKPELQLDATIFNSLAHGASL